MSNLVRSTRCRPSEDRSNRWITMMMIVAMFGFAGQVFADAGIAKPVAPAQGGAKQIAVIPGDGESGPTGDQNPLAPSVAFAAPPANDTCAGAVALTLNKTTYGTTV